MTNKYPAVLFVARYGRRLALVVGVVIASAALVALIFGQPTVVAAAGLIAAAAFWGLLRLLAEIVEVVAETLLPR